ncbi:AAA family ATPase [Streptococcus suis]|uniref:AAA family ATPase n=7 Tax=Streptococcus suis TaxID=1307 RepID=UPI00194EFD44|nr:ATP-binding protein [Streptococcus suis]MBM6381249.1 ATP-binding protein [Streptococcus suis]MBM6391109.1 ATP-binding protein [Streptococcus suis]MBM6393134.1 ATP-binding protein [Streptococcus suis]MBM6438786.1 ATP-binding protein [Streptococcus suis]MBM6449055.1 ATP-binding protein [Streptococcus suis]
MLINFRFENFLSYKELADFSMIASKVKSHKHYTREIAENILLLNFSAIYGANAAGKSNFISALTFARTFILSNKNKLRLNLLKDSYFKADENFKFKDTKFEFDFFCNDKVYTYGFSINLINSNLKEEWLYKHEDGRDLEIFNLDYSMDFDITHIPIQNWNIKEEDLSRFNIYISDSNKSDSLFLKYINSSERKVDYSLDIYEVYNWFLHTLEIVPAEGRVSQSEDVFLRQEDTKKLAEFLHSFGTGISKIEKEKIGKTDIDDIPDNRVLDSIIERVIEENEKSNSSEIASLVRTNENIYFFSVDESHNIIIERLYFIHDGTTAKFALRAESDGTRRLIDIYGVLNNIDKKVFVIDEIDRSFHPNLTFEFIKRSLENKSIQLIVTTHEDRLLDLSLLRRDQIWFVDKNEGESGLYSLEQYKVRFDKDILKEYLKGKYGSIPQFHFLTSEE